MILLAATNARRTAVDPAAIMLRCVIMDLSRFIDAQRDTYAAALAELRDGAKRSHWMWFVFPQIAGLGQSQTARLYAIRDLAEARAYLAHPILGPRLIEAATAVVQQAGNVTADRLMGQIDAVKLRSSMTLFEAVAPGTEVFGAVIDAFYDGKRDPETLRRL